MLGPDTLILLGDKESLEQVLLHLVQNAIDATPNDADAIIIQWHRKGDMGYIEIADQGTGMSADFVRNKLFKPFSSQKPGGFGIGAFEAKALVIAMGGMLEVESIENVGTRMIISLPVAKSDISHGKDKNEAVQDTDTNTAFERA